MLTRRLPSGEKATWNQCRTRSLHISFVIHSACPTLNLLSNHHSVRWPREFNSRYPSHVLEHLNSLTLSPRVPCGIVSSALSCTIKLIPPAQMLLAAHTCQTAARWPLRTARHTAEPPAVGLPSPAPLSRLAAGGDAAGGERLQAATGSQRRTVWSREEEASRRPSLLKATLYTCSIWK